MPREIDEAFIEEAIERYRRIEALQHRFESAVGAAEVTVRSPDGLVEIVVCLDGSVRDVSIGAAMQARTPAEVSRSVRDALQAAADAARWARDKLHAETFGQFPALEAAPRGVARSVR